ANIGAGDNVAFLLDNGYWTAALFLGVMYAGRVIVPINAVGGASQVEYVIEHSETRTLLVSSKYREMYADAIASAGDTLTIIEISPDVGGEWLSNCVENVALPSIDANDIALMIYTSGTTGRPKGVLLSHKNVLAGGANTAGSHELSSDDCTLCVLPLYHINAEMVSMMGPLVSNSSVVMPHGFSASKFWDWIAEYQCTWTSFVPTIVSYLIDTESRREVPTDFASLRRHLRFCRSASAALPPATHREFEKMVGVPIIETMGISEGGGPILSNPPDPAQFRYGSPGKAFGNEARIVDDNNQAVPPNTKGEIVVRGDNIMQGYFKNPEETAKTLDTENWMHTGDVGYMDEDGYFFVTGRIKELIIKGGENIAPREIDDVLYKHPAVLEAAAFGAPCDQYGQEVFACVALKEGSDCTVEELNKLCVEQLGNFKSPKLIHFLPELPKGPSGKIQRLKLQEIVAS
ncbi:MAG: AMP-binding protein, partial [Pseudomonadota bacterium]